MSRHPSKPWDVDELLLVHTGAARGIDNRALAAAIHRTPGDVDLALWAMIGRAPIPGVLAELNAGWVGPACPPPPPK